MGANNIILVKDNDGVGATSNIAFDKVKYKLTEQGFTVSEVMPQQINNAKTDFNDIHLSEGVVAVKQIIKEPITVEIPTKERPIIVDTQNNPKVESEIKIESTPDNQAPVENDDYLEYVQYAQPQEVQEIDVSPSLDDVLEYNSYIQNVTPIEKTPDSIKVDRPIDASYMPQDTVTLAAEHLAQYQTSFTRSELIQTATKLFIGKHSITEIEKAINKQVQIRKLLKSVNTKNGDISYVCHAELHRERNISSIVRCGAKQKAIASKETVQSAIDAFHDRKETTFTLSDDQQKALVRILGCPDQYQAVQGYAGTGKTTVMSLVRELAESAGVSVRGFAPTNDAVSQLQSETGINSETLDNFILNQQKQGSVPEKQLWIVDESSMTSNIKMLDFLKLAQKHKAQVLLLGDITQLSAIEAGKPFEILQKQGIYLTTIDTIQRQQTEVLKQAVQDIINDAPTKALNDLNEHGMVYQDKKSDCLQNIADEYASMSSKERSSTLVVVGSNDDRHAVNNCIRERLQKDGVVDSKNVSIEVAQSRNMSKAMCKVADSYQVGDLIRFGRNIKSHDIEKGQYAYVKEINKKSNLIHLSIKSKEDEKEKLITINPKKYASMTAYKPETRDFSVGDKIRITQSSVKDHGLSGGQEMLVTGIEDGKIIATDGHRHKHEIDTDKWKHFDYAYSSTAYAAQGKSYKNVLAYIDSNNRYLTNHKSFYVFVSRVKEKLKIYTNNKDKLLDRVTTKDTKTSVYDLFRDLDVKVHTEKENDKAPEKDKPNNYLMDLINAMHDKPKEKENMADRERVR
jgi:hypothetical protein